MEEFRFTNFQVYRSAKIFLREVFIVTNGFTERYKYLSNQINRAALSIVLNVAEGAGKKSDKDFNRYIQIALGSVHEVYAALDVARDLKIINEEKFNQLTALLLEIRKQLGGFSKKLNADS